MDCKLFDLDMEIEKAGISNADEKAVKVKAEEAKENKTQYTSAKQVLEKMTGLVKQLNTASDAYYNGKEAMSDFDYDALFDELCTLEKETGIVLPNSPTQTVGAAVVSKLEKVQHEYPALSLDKTKKLAELSEWLRDKKGMLSWKMDGLTVCLTYDNGKLVRAVTRGNGFVGEDITHNARCIHGIPATIPYMGHMVVRGEAVMTYAEFERINEELPVDDKYKNPRNLASGTVRALDSGVCKERRIEFFAFQVVAGDDSDSFCERLDSLDSYGFQTVEREYISETTLAKAVEQFKNRIVTLPYPTDGLVLEFDSVSYGESLGSTGHHPRYGIAFKWEDAIEKTTLRKIEWSASRTGLLNPVAIFDPVELEGTTVERASLHNVSYILEKDLRIGDQIGVYKANMIIPQVGENFSTTELRSSTKKEESYDIAHTCPVCGMATHTMVTKDKDRETIVLMCPNPFCAAKQIGKFVHFCDRDCMNIEGMSEKKIERFLEEGIIKEYSDFWHLDRHKDKIISMEGFGEKSYENMIAAAEKSRQTDFVSFIHSCGIPNIGKGQAKLLKNHLVTIFDEENGQLNPDGSYDFMDLLLRLSAKEYDFSIIEGFGDVIAKSLQQWITEKLVFPSTLGVLDFSIKNVLKEITFTDRPTTLATGQPLSGKTFVITGSLMNYKNRDELVAKIESLGGKVSGSVSAKTSYLINNDVTSTSGKNKKAKDLGIPIISEADFDTMY